MCEIKGEYKGSTFTGYKGAYRDEQGVIRSLVSRIEYQLGPVPVVETDVVSIWGHCIIRLHYDARHRGKTGVFKTFEDAAAWVSNTPNWVILEMTISGDLTEGYTEVNCEADDISPNVVMGSNIDAIEVYL